MQMKALTGTDRRNIEEVLLKLSSESGKRSLENNYDETKYLNSTRRNMKKINEIEIGKYILERVHNFSYSDKIISKTTTVKNYRNVS